MQERAAVVLDDTLGEVLGPEPEDLGRLSLSLSLRDSLSLSLTTCLNATCLIQASFVLCVFLRVRDQPCFAILLASFEENQR